jgi:hypothetical protein
VSSTTKPNKNPKYSSKVLSNDAIVNLPLLIKAVDEALLKSNKEKIPRKYRNKKYIGKDKSGYYIM